MAGHQLRHVASAMADGLLAAMPPRQLELLEMVTKEITKRGKEAANEAIAEWRRLFAGGHASCVKVTAKGMRAAPGGDQVAEDMRAFWARHWQKEVDHEAITEAWQEAAARVGHPREEERVWTETTVDDLGDALWRTKGSASTDGWAGDELRWLVREWPDLLLAASRLLNGMVQKDGRGEALEEDELRMLEVRAVGIPKKSGAAPSAGRSCGGSRQSPPSSSVGGEVQECQRPSCPGSAPRARRAQRSTWPRPSTR